MTLKFASVYSFFANRILKAPDHELLLLHSHALNIYMNPARDDQTFLVMEMLLDLIDREAIARREDDEAFHDFYDRDALYTIDLTKE